MHTAGGASHPAARFAGWTSDESLATISPVQIRDLARLAACTIFSGVEPNDLAASLASVRYLIRLYDKGSTILTAGSAYEALYVLLEGEAWAEMTSDEGKVVQVESFKAVEAFASAILFTPRRALPVTVLAKTECRVVSIDRDGLLTLCMRHRPILEALLSEVGSRLDTLADRLRAAQFISLREKLSDWLLRRRDLSGSNIVHMEATRDRLAELFGVARPSLSRELGALQREGVLELAGKDIRILDPEALRRARSRRACADRR